MGFKVLFRLFSNFYIYQKKKRKEKKTPKINRFPRSPWSGWFCRCLSSRAVRSPTRLASSEHEEISMFQASVPPARNRRLPAILVGPGSEPLILKIKKQNREIPRLRGPLCLTLL